MGSYVNPVDVIYNIAAPYRRGDSFPIDETSIFASYAEANNYVKGTNAVYGQIAYVGQIISVHENGKVDVYKVDEDGPTGKKLSKIGAGTLSADTYNAAIQLAKTAEIGQLINLTKEDTTSVPNTTYAPGLYIVTAPGQIQKLGITSGTSDELGAVNSAISTLRTKVTELEKTGQYKIIKLGQPAEGNAIASYQLQVRDMTKSVETWAPIGDIINIPKDLVVSKGEVVKVDDTNISEITGKLGSGTVAVGDYVIKLTIQHGSPIYIPAKSLVDVYTAGNGILIEDNKVSLKVNPKGALNVDGAGVSLKLATTSSYLTIDTALETGGLKVDFNSLKRDLNIPTMPSLDGFIKDVTIKDANGINIISTGSRDNTTYNIKLKDAVAGGTSGLLNGILAQKLSDIGAIDEVTINNILGITPTV